MLNWHARWDSFPWQGARLPGWLHGLLRHQYAMYRGLRSCPPLHDVRVQLGAEPCPQWADGIGDPRVRVHVATNYLLLTT